MRQDVMKVNRPAGIVSFVGRGHQFAKLDIVSDHLVSGAIPRDPLSFVKRFNFRWNIAGLDVEVVRHGWFPLGVEWTDYSLIGDDWKSEGESSGDLIWPVSSGIVLAHRVRRSAFRRSELKTPPEGGTTNLGPPSPTGSRGGLGGMEQTGND